MAEVNIYFNELASEVQEELKGIVKHELLKYKDVEPKGKNESEKHFQQRLWEAVDRCINNNTFTNRFVI